MTPTVTIDMNDAAFLAKILEKYMIDELYSTGHMRNLVKTLEGSTRECNCQRCEKARVSK
jgi:hypothetical protein